MEIKTIGFVPSELKGEDFNEYLLSKLCSKMKNFIEDRDYKTIIRKHQLFDVLEKEECLEKMEENLSDGKYETIKQNFGKSEQVTDLRTKIMDLTIKIADLNAGKILSKQIKDLNANKILSKKEDILAEIRDPEADKEQIKLLLSNIESMVNMDLSDQIENLLIEFKKLNANKTLSEQAKDILIEIKELSNSDLLSKQIRDLNIRRTIQECITRSERGLFDKRQELLSHIFFNTGSEENCTTVQKMLLTDFLENEIEFNEYDFIYKLVDNYHNIFLLVRERFDLLGQESGKIDNSSPSNTTLIGAVISNIKKIFESSENSIESGRKIIKQILSNKDGSWSKEFSEEIKRIEEYRLRAFQTVEICVKEIIETWKMEKYKELEGLEKLKETAKKFESARNDLTAVVLKDSLSITLIIQDLRKKQKEENAKEEDDDKIEKPQNKQEDDKIEKPQNKQEDDKIEKPQKPDKHGKNYHQNQKRKEKKKKKKEEKKRKKRKKRKKKEKFI